MAEAVTRVIITGEDRTAAAFASVQRGAREITAVIGKLQTAFGAVGVALSAGAAFGWAKDVVAAASALDDLADSTGSSVENLSRLANQARISGRDFGELETLVNRMAAGMGGADEQTTRVKDGLRALGVSAKDPAQAVFEVAKAFEKYADGANKAALAREIFGKGGPQFLATLKDLAQAQETIATVTAQQARDAEKLEQAWRRLGVESTTLKNALLNNIVPALTDTITAFNLARKGSLDFWSSLQIAAVGGMGQTETALKALEERLAKLKSDKAAGKTGWFGTLDKEIADIEKKLPVLRKVFAESLGDTSWLNKEKWKPEAPTIPPQAKAGVDEYARALDALRKSSAGAQAELLALTSQTQEMVPAQKQLAEIMASDLWKKAPQAWRDQYEAMAKAEIATQQQVRDFKALGEAAADFAAKLKAERDAWDAQVSANRAQADELVKTLEREVAVQGLSNEQREISNALLALEKLGITEATEGYEEYVRRVTDAVIAKEAFAKQQLALREQAEAFQKTYDEISRTISDALMRGFESGKDWARNFIDTLKNMFGNLVLRPVIQAVLAPVTGGLSSLISGGASAASLGSAGASAGLSLFGASDFTAALAGDAFLPGALGAGGGGAASLGSTIGAGLGTAAPYLAVAVAIYALAKTLSKSPGGPRVQGYAEAGNFLGGMPSGWSTPDNTLRSTVQPVVEQLATSYADLVKKFGGSGTGGFALRIDTDPKGTARGGIGVSAQVGGKTVYMSDPAKLGDFVGRSEAEINAAMQVEGKRALLAALKASHLPDDIARILDAVDVATATSDQIDKLFQVATAIGQIGEAVTSLDDVNATLDKLGDGHLVDVFRLQGEALDDLITNFDGSAEATDALAAASGEYYQSLIALQRQIRQVTEQIDKMFAGTRETINTAGRDNDWLYNYYQQDAERQKQLLATLTDPEKIAEASARANEDILKAFQLLSPEDQAASRQAFLDGIDAFNRAADDRLRELGDNASAAFKSDMETVKELLTQVVTDMQTAANTQLTAGNLQLEAATTPIQVVVTGPGGGEIGGG